MRIAPVCGHRCCAVYGATAMSTNDCGTEASIDTELTDFSREVTDPLGDTPRTGDCPVCSDTYYHDSHPCFVCVDYEQLEQQWVQDND